MSQPAVQCFYAAVKVDVDGESELQWKEGRKKLEAPPAAILCRETPSTRKRLILKTQ